MLVRLRGHEEEPEHPEREPVREVREPIRRAFAACGSHFAIQIHNPKQGATRPRSKNSEFFAGELGAGRRRGLLHFFPLNLSYGFPLLRLLHFFLQLSSVGPARDHRLLRACTPPGSTLSKDGIELD